MTPENKQNLYALILAFLVFLSLFFIWIQAWSAVIGPAFLAFLIWLSKLRKQNPPIEQTEHITDED